MKFPEKYRVRKGANATPEGVQWGWFHVRNKFDIGGPPLLCMAVDGENPSMPWDHVSVSLPTRCPTWDEMCFVKSLFWNDEDTVMQLHPPRSQWISNARYCLHLWRPLTLTFAHEWVPIDIDMPPSIGVGVREFGELPT